MKIAIIGAGFAGLALAWHLRHTGEITLFDEHFPSYGASAAAAGLLHPFVGREGKLNLHGFEALAEAKTLIHIAEDALGRTISMGPIKRVFEHETKLIEQGVSIFPDLYLQGLLLACQKAGVQCIQTKVEQLEGYDRVVWTAGAGIFKLKIASQLPIRPVKGQIVIYDKPFEGLPTIGQGYCVPTSTGLTALGATFEHDTLDATPDLAVAMALLEKERQFFHLEKFEPITCQAGIRVMPPRGQLPIMTQMSSNTWVFTGLGSKGLLYHAFCARQLAEKL